MKSVLITFDQAYYERIMSLLDRLGCRGFTYLEKVQGRGSKRPNTMPSAIARSTLGSKPNLCFIRCRFIGFRLDDSCVGALGRSCSRFGPNSFFGGPVACRFSINV